LTIKVNWIEKIEVVWEATRSSLTNLL